MRASSWAYACAATTTVWVVRGLRATARRRDWGPIACRRCAPRSREGYVAATEHAWSRYNPLASCGDHLPPGIWRNPARVCAAHACLQPA
eukprot:scaffold19984_cov127-Isochrysis_galbana.AAC.10